MVDRTHDETKLWESFHLKEKTAAVLKKFIDAIIRYVFLWNSYGR